MKWRLIVRCSTCHACQVRGKEEVEVARLLCHFGDEQHERASSSALRPLHKWKPRDSLNLAERLSAHTHSFVNRLRFDVFVFLHIHKISNTLQTGIQCSAIIIGFYRQLCGFESDTSASLSRVRPYMNNFDRHEDSSRAIIDCKMAPRPCSQVVSIRLSCEHATPRPQQAASRLCQHFPILASSSCCS